MGGYRTRSNQLISNIENKTNTTDRDGHETTPTTNTTNRSEARAVVQMPRQRRTHNTQQQGNYTKRHKARSTSEFKRNRLVLLKDQPLCHWCNTRTATTADHLIEIDRYPTDQAGINSLDNLVAACKPCNSSRGARYGNLKRKGITEQTPTININNTRNRIFIHETPAPDSPLSLSNKGYNGLALISADQPVHKHTAPYKPRLETAVERDGTYLADGVTRWAREYLNCDLMDWQRYIVGGVMAHDEHGNLLARQALVSVARQNGKSKLLESLVGFWCTEMPKLRGEPQTIITTAHKLDLAIELFHKVAPVLEQHFGAILTWAVGRNEANLPDGTRWLVRAATPTSFHGLTADLVAIDELWAVSPDSVSVGCLPTMRTRKSPLLFMTSTSGDESSAEMLRWREQGLRAIDDNKTGSFYFAEYSPDATTNPMTVEAWLQANPAIGHTLSVDVLQAEAEQPNRAAFLRSSVNLWVASSNSWLEPGVWEKLKTDKPMPNGGVLSIEISQDESRFVGVRAVANSDGVVHVCQQFVKDTLAECWQAVDDVCKDTTTRLLITPAFEMSLPMKYAGRSQMVGNRELNRWTAATRSAIIEGRIIHDGSKLLDQHVARAVAVKNQGQLTLSSLRSPGAIDMARCLVFAFSLANKPVSMGKPMIVVASR
ncbi:HNHc domain containing protein [uncultured Caudovirales phage]|uniref:HNHc domain containing protein n=1 Tax=uncultured Caudovirales phage TaxID=2100421 RepID=A0A6J5NVL9_9CAUD|nr:HNHc domain containing protein [uncultured Caudovirales phage]